MEFEIKAPKTIDYEKEGLMVGLEFHQQIMAPFNSDQISRDNGSKLFCPCPARLREDDPDFKIMRSFRAVSGETGDVDISAVFERMKLADTIYEGYFDTTCLIELDEEPILPINQQALFRSLAIAKNIFKLELVDEILVSRKTIIDGSNTSGFQRTAQIAYESKNSKITVNGKKISIYQANLEEDSAKNVGREGAIRKFRLDRLGIPLIEIATGPDMSTPEDVLATAKRIGELLRTTGFVKRGQGTIRQDLNVSIKRGSRIEIKGVSDLDLLIPYVQNESIRQSRMLQLLDLLKYRKLTKRKVSSIKPKDLTKYFKKCEAKFIKKALKKGEVVIGAKLPGCKGLLGFELQPNYRLGTEFSEICKIIAGVGGILHSDELPKFGITQDEVNSVINDLNLKDEDGFFLVVASKTQGTRSVEGVKVAINMWLDQNGIVPEVRAPRGDGTTGYLRPLPGKARMYPETDSQPIKLTKNLLDKINKTKFEMPEERIKRYQQDFGLSIDLADQLSIHADNDLFEELVSNLKVDPTLVASTILSTLVNLRREGLEIEKITRERLHDVFDKLTNNQISKDAIERVLIAITKSPTDTLIDTIIEEAQLEKIDENEIEIIVEKLVDQNLDLVKERGMASMGSIMRKVMEELGGKAEGKVVSTLVRKAIDSRSAK